MNLTINKFSSFSYSTSTPKPDDAGYIKYFNVTLSFSKTANSILNLDFDRELIRDNNTNSLKNQKLTAPVYYLVPDRIFIEYPMNYTVATQEYGKAGIPIFSLALSNYIV